MQSQTRVLLLLRHVVPNIDVIAAAAATTGTVATALTAGFIMEKPKNRLKALGLYGAGMFLAAHFVDKVRHAAIMVGEKLYEYNDEGLQQRENEDARAAVLSYTAEYTRWTSVSCEDFQAWFTSPGVQTKYRKDTYQLGSNNCQHFTAHASTILGIDPPAHFERILRACRFHLKRLNGLFTLSRSSTTIRRRRAPTRQNRRRQGVEMRESIMREEPGPRSSATTGFERDQPDNRETAEGDDEASPYTLNNI